MTADTKVLGLINARGGSKGVPRKNIRLLADRPLIAYAIDAALGAMLIDTVVVSTDDDEIAATAKTLGARVPFMRPTELASDTALQIDTIRHAVLTLEEAGEHYSHIAVLQPTAPLRIAKDIDAVVSVLIETGADSAVSLVRISGVLPYTYYHLEDGGRMRSFLDVPARGNNRQSYPDLFERSGAVYAMRRETVIDKASIYGEDSRGVELPIERSVNIDTLFDWRIAEALMSDPAWEDRTDKNS